MRNAVIIVLLVWGALPALAQIEPEMLMNLSSREFITGGMIPAEYTCDGRNASPPLKIDRVPEAAKSLALIVTDEDAPGGTFTHWLAWNIDPKRTEFLKDTVPPEAIQGKNDFGKTGYGGPCPPSGVHRYYFRIYALDKTLDLSSGATRNQVEKAMKGHVLMQAELMGKYMREKAQ